MSGSAALWIREITKVGEVTSLIPSAAPMPCTNTVFPAPNGPLTKMRSPARHIDPIRVPSSCISAADAIFTREG